ncbi:hypothetical protein ACFQI7_03230 [Paenibacillus allorhizosphaerae]|uniref:Uncharacterized protein n=1 Tax=Paenibacillus allorhizosphaerae TaxID=2849866 RepID=A0ABM8VBC4_9BACL|nr:hypothetical protein [Paenibacillus allorhizosphaerae]CAG7619287.1 hypothetical protein PAECIP111802_00605 [Paenibacillus allorhizosphaerae]
MSATNISGVVWILMIIGAVVLAAGAVVSLSRRRSNPVAWKRIGWTALSAAAFAVAFVQYGPFIGRAVGMEYPLSVPKALIALETGKARLVPLTSDAVKLVGRRGPTERELTVFLSERGWQFKEKTDNEFTYRKEDAVLTVHSRFRRGYWWYDLDRAPK